MNRKRTVIFIVSAILIIFFFISGCKKDHGEDAVLTYESEYFPLVDIELGISEAELRSTFDGESIYTGEDYLAGKNRYRVFIRKLEERQYGGLLTEQYYFDETEDELVCMKASIGLFAPAEYYYNEETEAELFATGYDNIRIYSCGFRS
ncbi:MAG: hypothetical protein E7218_04260 [Anaerofustis stercorihominis]|nr:hypothetical protein [Anaerofustis stercorihominis]